MSAAIAASGGEQALANLRQAYAPRVQEQREQQEKEEDDDAPGEDEWAEIEARTQEVRAKEVAERGRLVAPDDPACSPMTYREVEEWLHQLRIDEATLEQFQHEVDDRVVCCCTTRRRACDVRGLDKKLWQGKDMVLFLKATNFDFNDLTHFRMLRTAYLKLSRNKTCPSIGRHWEVLGFQHTDPRTDLNRSGGVLNVLHFFFFFSHYFDILKAAYLLAQDGEQNFPLACVSINLTRMTIECLLAGRLSRLCNRDQKGVVHTTCEVYAGALFHFYSRWRTQKRTIQDSEVTFKEVRYLLERQPQKLLQGLEQGIKEQRDKTDASKFEFTDLDFGGAPAKKPPAPQQQQKAAAPGRWMNYQDRE